VLDLIFNGGKLTKCHQPFKCNTDIDSSFGIVLWLMIMIYMFKQLGTICDEYFVPALEVIVERLEMSNDVAGATFMAAGSSAPELFTSLVATFLIVNEGGVGTIIGSAIFNILVIVGATGYVACRDRALPIWWYPLTRDCIFYSISIGELYLVLYDEEVRWYEGVIMILTYIGYCLFMKINPMIIERFGIKSPENAKDVEDAEKDPKEVSSWQDPVQEVKVGVVEDREESPEITPEVDRPEKDSDRDCEVVGINADVVQMVKLSSPLPNAVPCPSPLGPGDVALCKSSTRQSLGGEPRSGSHPKWSMRESQNSTNPVPLPVIPDANVKSEIVVVAPADEDGPGGTTAAEDDDEEDIDLAVRVSAESSLTTHPGSFAADACAFLGFVIVRALTRSPGCEKTAAGFLDECCEAYLQRPAADEQLTLKKLLLGREPVGSMERCWNWRDPNGPFLSETLDARGHCYNGYPVDPGYFGSYCMDGLAVALHCVYHTTSFMDAITLCVNFLGDADSVGAVCGQIAGAIYGVNAMDERLIAAVETWDAGEIALRAALLYAAGAKLPGEAAAFVEPSKAGIQTSGRSRQDRSRSRCRQGM